MNDTDEPDNVDNSDSIESNELDALSPHLAALLSDHTTWAEPPAGLGERVMDAVRAEPTSEVDAPVETVPATAVPVVGRIAWLRPALLGAAAAIVLLFGGIIVLSALSGVDELDTFAVELVSTGAIPDVGGDIEITSFDSGLQIDLSAPALPRRDDGAFYEAWVSTSDGNLFPVGTFHEGDDVTLWAGVELDRIERFTITLETAAGPTDPAQASSGDVVLRAAIP